MAKIEIKHTCGCGFSTRDLEKATEHCNSSGHSMFVLGNIYPDELKTARAHRPYIKPTASTSKSSTIPDVPLSEDFNVLRRRLKKEGQHASKRRLGDSE